MTTEMVMGVLVSVLGFLVCYLFNKLNASIDGLTRAITRFERVQAIQSERLHQQRCEIDEIKRQCRDHECYFKPEMAVHG